MSARTRAHLAGVAGAGAGAGDVSDVATDDTERRRDVDLGAKVSREQPWPLADVVRCEAMQIVEDLQAKLPIVPSGPWPDPPRSAVVCPIRSHIAHQLAGLLVLGISSRLVFDDRYRG